MFHKKSLALQYPSQRFQRKKLIQRQANTPAPAKELRMLGHTGLVVLLLI